MSLHAPHLDDRRFQDLVDDAKRLVQQRCPEWTDHNVSDPGVTMIELFAWMVDQLLYRLNRVPERNYVKFLELIGVRLLPPADAEGDVTFWLSAPQPAVLAVPVGTEVATLRTETEEAVTFTVEEHLDIVPCSLDGVATAKGGKGGKPTDQTDKLTSGQQFPCFEREPKPDDALLVGLSAAVPRCAVVLRFDCHIEGVGVDPTNPPLVWEAWDGKGWSACELDRDETGGLNRAGDVVLHVPPTHTTSLIGGRRAGWLRCRVVPVVEGQPDYSSSPQIARLTACTIGGTTRVTHAELVRGEVLGVSDGVAGQHFELRRRPVVRGGPPVTLEVAAGDGAGWVEWTAVESFGDSGPSDHHFVLDEVGGQIALGPAVREADGTLRQFGAVPPKGAVLRVPVYRSGGGRKGNVARRAITVLKSSIPYVTRVENRRPAIGGVDPETVEEAKVRGPMLLRTGHRAVTAEDFEHLARQACPDVGRVRCVPAGENGDDTAVRVLVVPSVTDDGGAGRLHFEDLVPPDDLLSAIADYLGPRKVLGIRVVVEPPVYQGITVVASLRARPRMSPNRLQAEALDALYCHFHPLAGGDEGRGWPFGRPVQAGEVYAVLQRVRGVELVEDLRLFGADPITGKRGESVTRLDLAPNALVFSYQHQIRVEEP